MIANAAALLHKQCNPLHGAAISENRGRPEGHRYTGDWNSEPTDRFKTEGTMPPYQLRIGLESSKSFGNQETPSFLKAQVGFEAGRSPDLNARQVLECVVSREIRCNPVKRNDRPEASRSVSSRSSASPLSRAARAILARSPGELVASARSIPCQGLWDDKTVCHLSLQCLTFTNFSENY